MPTDTYFTNFYYEDGHDKPNSCTRNDDNTPRRPGPTEVTTGRRQDNRNPSTNPDEPTQQQQARNVHDERGANEARRAATTPPRQDG
jgi:hypothetical protein